jgi:hypothetical protein
MKNKDLQELLSIYDDNEEVRLQINEERIVVEEHMIEYVRWYELDGPLGGQNGIVIVIEKTN